jgi:hypothetical protein
MLGNSRLHSTIMPLTSQPADENWRPHDDSELEHLRRSWGGWYAVAFDAGTWTAQPHAGGQPITGGSANELRNALRLDWRSQQAKGWHDARP